MKISPFGLPVDVIRAELSALRTRMSIAVVRAKNPFNIGAIIRVAHSFLVKEIFLIGTEPFYERAEWDFGVAGSGGANPFAAPRKKGFPNPPHPERLAARLAGRSAKLKALLLDQSFIAGVGNIYASEALHLARISCQASRFASTIRLITTAWLG